MPSKFLKLILLFLYLSISVFLCACKGKVADNTLRWEKMGWKTGTITPSLVLEGHESGSAKVKFVTQGRVVTSVRDNNIRLWDANSGEQLASFLGPHSNHQFDVQKSPDGNSVILSTRASAIFHHSSLLISNEL